MTEAKSAQPQLPPLDYSQADWDYADAAAKQLKEQRSYSRPSPVTVVERAAVQLRGAWASVSCRERQLLSLLAENESLKAAKPLRMFVWDGRGAYKISVCAPRVAEARTLALDEIAVHGMSEIENSPMFRAKAQVMQEQPHIYLRPNAELVLSENGETEELNICLESESAKRQSAESQLATMEAECDTLRSEAAENARIIGMSGSREAKLLTENKSLKDKLDFCGEILGEICVYGTLLDGEKPVHPSPHAAIDAILTQINRAETAEAERDQALEVIREFYTRTGVIDNGKCAVCRQGFRSWKLPNCKTPSGPCSNEHCLSHKADELLSRETKK